MSQLSKFPQWGAPAAQPNKNVVLYSLNCISSNPYKSHPARYWKKDNGKLLKLFEEAKSKEADLILLNYSKTNDNFKSMKVINATTRGIKTTDTKFKGLVAYNNFMKDLATKYSTIL
jgi:hypothetical protein